VTPRRWAIPFGLHLVDADQVELDRILGGRDVGRGLVELASAE
jgi:hypothetical protein